MTFSSTLQLRVLSDHSMDTKIASPRGLGDRGEDNNADPKMRCSISSDGRWPSLKHEDASGSIFLDGSEHSGASSGFSHLPSSVHHDSSNDGALSSGLHDAGSSDPLTIHVGNDGGVGSGAGAHSDWHAISSSSFDDTYLDHDYTSTGMSLASSSSASSLSHLNEPMNKLALGSEDHDLPVISMPYPGTSWFLGGKSEDGGGNNGFAIPTLGGLTPQSQVPCSATTQSSAPCTINTPSFHSSSVGYSSSTGKLPGDTMPPSDAHSPVQMESFTPCLPHALEPSELLFEDMSTWTGGTAEVYDNQHYHNQHGQPFYNVSLQMSAPNGFMYFDGASSNTGAGTMTTPLRDYAPPFQHHQLHSNATPGPSIYRMMQNRDETFRSDTRWMASQGQLQFAAPSTASTTPTDSGKSHENHNDSGHGNQLPNALGSLHEVDEGQAIKRLLRSSTLNQRGTNCFLPTGSTPKASNAMTGKVMPRPATSSVALNQSAKIQLLTVLNDCYWKNGRKNLQCFPSCPEHHDFYSMKMNNRKHSSVGVCRGPVYCHAFTNAAEFLPAASTQHVKHEHGGRVPCGGSGAREVFVLGRFERVPQQESTNLMEELNAPPSFPNAAVFEQFRFTCFQAVEMEERRVLLPDSPNDQAADSSNTKSDSFAAHPKKRFIRSTWFFLPDVWKVQPMLKKKRKATRSAPAQTFPFCFRIFIYTRDANSPRYSCIADTASTFFELYSTRTVDRVKRKYWSGETQRNAKQQRGLNRL
ncbi:hypothetical protein PF002_g9482 [Phytophthora fragariae]|uniref:Uncharacterized protein n=7 Tax=Phytophthora fragariae TaxID=53985 RepID=A0A6A3SW47_9STRA|nr:hypothetical protein PF003_g38467 [Phytophthora fragariae]KAE8942280.1 hypothetical protein PF009_g7964 [Phytophthora fragariae]KAE9122376.1 hypothetical protein PF007_g7480 [Phytophthora fragariae]KAE9241012.1 hypothetical protein PF002_g9482 [Phytophthora fragariae]